MNKKFYMYFILFLIGTLTSSGQQTSPDSASLILKSAIEKSKSTDKTVLIIYHATWCSWCKKLDSVLQEPAIKQIFDRHYVTIHLDVRERGEKIKTDENPGAYETLVKYGGKKSGIPFMVFLNKKGKMIANSNVMPDKENIGYPGAEKEIAAFIKLLKKTSPRITKKELSVISEYLKKKAPK